MKRILLFALVAALSLTFYDCGSSRNLAGLKPEITSVRPRITGIDLSGVNLAFDVDVLNPYPRTIRSPQFRYALDISGQQLAQAAETVAVDLPARDTGTVTLPVRVGYLDLWQMAQNLRGANEVSYTLHGALLLPVAGKNFELPLEKSGSFPVLHLPRVSNIRPRLEGTGVTGRRLAVGADLTNPNVFALGLEKLGYRVRLGDVDLGGLTASTLEKIAAGDSRPVELSGQLTAGNLAQILSGAGLGGIKLEPTGAIDTPYGPVSLSQ